MIFSGKRRNECEAFDTTHQVILVLVCNIRFKVQVSLCCQYYSLSRSRNLITAAIPDAAKSPEKNGYATGDAVEVKEGGKVYRAATVLKVDEVLGCVDLVYADGEKECGVPVNLIRKTAGGGAAPAAVAAAAPPGMAAVALPMSAAEAPPSDSGRPRREKGSREKARQCYELVKSFSETEQEAALTMLMALNSVRGGAAT